MVEVVGGIVGHAELLHDPAGLRVGDAGVGDELGEVEGVEAVAEGGGGGLGGVALAPEGAGDAPAEFDGGGEVGLIADVVEAYGADELAGAGGFCGPEADAVFGLVGDLAVDPGVGQGGGGHGEEELLEAWVLGHGEKGGAVLVLPGAEGEAGGLEGGHA